MTPLTSLSTIMSQKQPIQTRKKAVLEWQDRAVRYAQKLGIDRKGMDKQWFKCFRDVPLLIIERSMSFVADYPTEQNKKKLFYWAIWQFKKYGRIKKLE